jgi:hypothetical protein
MPEDTMTATTDRQIDSVVSGESDDLGHVGDVGNSDPGTGASLVVLLVEDLVAFVALIRGFDNFANDLAAKRVQV